MSPSRSAFLEQTSSINPSEIASEKKKTTAEERNTQRGCYESSKGYSGIIDCPRTASVALAEEQETSFFSR